MKLIIAPWAPINDLSNLVSGTVMILVGVTVFIKVYRGSKNTFAYTLLAFTIVMGISKIGFAFTDTFRSEVTMPDYVH